MITDTLRQKFIYATPFDKKEFPLVQLDKNLESKTTVIYKINALSLYFLEKEDFEKLIKSIVGKYNAVLIINDQKFKSQNCILKNGFLCYMMAFAFLFKQNNLKCNISE